MSELTLLEYDTIPSVKAFSTQRGCTSCEANEAPYASFNITHYCGDDPDRVRRNRALLAQHLSIANDRIVLPHQTHGDICKRIDADYLQCSAEEKTKFLYGVDAVYTTERKLCIGVSTADCVPVLIGDADAKVVAAIHAGWRGTVSCIVEKCISRICEDTGINPSALHAVIGPSISLEAFEVGDEVWERFSEVFNMSGISRQMNGKWHIDLWAANYECLLRAGLDARNIKVAGICTHANHHQFFSARRLGINSGRIFSGIMLE